MSGTAPDLVDPTVYPEEDHLGEPELQTLIRELLRPLIEAFFSSVGRVAHVGSDQFIYWVQYKPTESVSPDIYVLPGVAQSAVLIKSWKVWETGTAPSFALEVVSGDWQKDYTDNLRKYEDLGVTELVVFDPEAFEGAHPRTPERVAFQRFVLEDGRLTLVDRLGTDRVRCAELGCWLRVVGAGPLLRLRVATGTDGADVFPTEAERIAAENERVTAENERIRSENEELRARIRDLETKR